MVKITGTPGPRLYDEACPNPPSWSVHRKYAEVLCSCVVGATPSGTEGPPDSSFSAHLTPVFLPTSLSVFLHLLPPQSGLQELTKQDMTATSVYLLGLRDLRLSIFFIVVHFESS